MNFLTDKIRPIYFKYLAAAFGSALISAIYGVVDAAMAGQYQGPHRLGGAGSCCPGMEHHLQSGPADRYRRQRAFQHNTGQSGKQRKGIQ